MNLYIGIILSLLLTFIKDVNKVFLLLITLICLLMGSLLNYGNIYLIFCIIILMYFLNIQQI